MEIQVATATKETQTATTPEEAQTATTPEEAQTAAAPQQMEPTTAPATPATQRQRTTTLVVVGAVGLGLLALFGVGLMGNRIKTATQGATRGFAKRSREIDVPLGLPLLIGEFARRAR